MNRLTISLFAAGVLALGACKKEADSAEASNSPPAAMLEAAPAIGVATGMEAIAGAYKLDPGHSAVTFKVAHMNISHTLGRFNKVTGTLKLGATAASSEVSIEVATASVFTADKKRDDHLKSPDFLNAAQFPTIKFESTAVARAGDKRYRVTGDLELHGVTKEVTAEFEHVGSGKSMLDPTQFLVGFTGTLAIKRSEFGMSKMIGPVGDDIELLIAIEAVRQ